jgi:hypothetical protein
MLNSVQFLESVQVMGLFEVRVLVLMLGFEGIILLGDIQEYIGMIESPRIYSSFSWLFLTTVRNVKFVQHRFG